MGEGHRRVILDGGHTGSYLMGWRWEDDRVRMFFQESYFPQKVQNVKVSCLEREKDAQRGWTTVDKLQSCVLSQLFVSQKRGPRENQDLKIRKLITKPKSYATSKLCEICPLPDNQKTHRTLSGRWAWLLGEAGGCVGDSGKEVTQYCFPQPQEQSAER